MENNDELGSLRSFVWDVKQRSLEGHYSGTPEAEEGWLEAWDEVIAAMEEWGIDPNNLHGDTALAAAAVPQVTQPRPEPVRSPSREQVKKEVLDYYNRLRFLISSGGFAHANKTPEGEYPVMVAKALNLDPRQVFEVAMELKKDGLLEFASEEEARNDER